ncbi:hypothetical protein SBA4_2270003 [Candidatus Sulfopaludibacter sp. SbA4]|nr:hypothetical protein SBA4_2270003 [Candidatus Sulfopaludibacter sp. SbA4]
MQNNEAVRQGVIDRMAQKGVAGVEVTLTSVKYNGNEADVVANIAPKGGNQAAAMSMNYHLRQEGNKWVVVGAPDTGGSPHGGAAMPGAANPHGGGMAVPEAGPAGGAGKMPSPEDLPPAKKK